LTSAIPCSASYYQPRWAGRQGELAASGGNLVGPSRTGDIEMTHTIGVHGPKELHVFLIDDSDAV